MTLQELQEYFQLGETLDKIHDQIDGLYAAAQPGSPGYDGMPHARTVSDKVGTLAIEIADLERCAEELESKLETKKEAVSEFIKTVRFPERTYFRLRFIRGLRWKEVAAVVGGGNTEGSVKAAVYRYLRIK